MNGINVPVVSKASLGFSIKDSLLFSILFSLLINPHGETFHQHFCAYHTCNTPQTVSCECSRSKRARLP
jgi:hypothetical protein